MRRGVDAVLALVAAATVLASCAASSVQTLAPGATPPATPVSQGTPPSNADIYGTVAFDDHSTFVNPPGDVKGSGSDGVQVTVNVALIRDQSSGDYKDTGSSSFDATITSHREHEIGTDPNVCTGTSDGAGAATNKSFSASDPDDPGSSISVVYSPELGIFTLWADATYELTTTTNACMSGKATTETHWVGGPLGCGSFGLGGAVTVNPNGPDQVDMHCSVPYSNKDGDVTVSGTLTIRN